MEQNSSKAQYWISTFKPEILESEQTSFFEVKFANRESSIVKVGQSRAEDIIFHNLSNEQRAEETEE